MLLAIDIGNSNTVIGVFEGHNLVEEWRIQTVDGRTSDDLFVLFKSLFEPAGLRWDDIDDCVVSCVVPPMERAIQTLMRQRADVEPDIVGHNSEPRVPVAVKNPEQVGADRLVNAGAVAEMYDTSVIVVDFGTATTFDAVSEKGVYLGGVISPGVSISSEALFHAASKLPRVEIARPPSPIGETTVEAMQSGLYYGYAGLIKETVQKMRSELSDPCTVVSTGGLAELFADELDMIDAVEPRLTLMGLRYLARG